MWETTADALFHWRKRYYILWTCILVKNILMLDLFHLLSSPDVNWWTGVVWITCGLLWCFYQLFGLSFWRHPFTSEHPLLSKCPLKYFCTQIPNFDKIVLNKIKIKTTKLKHFLLAFGLHKMLLDVICLIFEIFTVSWCGLKEPCKWIGLNDVFRGGRSTCAVSDLV